MTFFFMFIFVFLVFWRPQEWLVPALFGLPLLDAVIAAASVAFLMELKEGKIRKPGKTVPLLFLGLFAATLMSHVAHTYFYGMMETLKATWKICFFSILFFCALDRPSRLRWVARLFVVMACVMATHALLQKYRGYGFVGARPLYIRGRPGEGWYYRSLFFGIFGDPNDLAQMLATSVPFCFILTKRQSVRSFLLGIAISAFLVMGLLTTRSRGGLIAFIVVTALMLTMLLPRRAMMIGLIGMCLGGLLLLPFAGSYLDTSAYERVVFWGQGNWAFKTSPVFGVGYGMFEDYVEGSRAAHNAFVLCYTEIGLFGYWFWFSLLMLGVVGCWRARAALTRVSTVEGAYLRRFAGIAIAAIAGFSASAYFLSRAFVYPMFVLFALLNAVPVVAQRMLPDEHAPLIRPKRDVWTWGTISSMASVVYIYISIVLLNKAYGG